MTNKRQFQICSYFLTRFMFFGGGFSFLLSIGKQDTWICMILGTLLGLLSFKIIELLKQKTNLTKISIFTKIILILLSILLTEYLLTGITVMTSSFFLYKTPPLLITTVIVLVIAYGVSKKENTFVKVAELLFFISIIVLIFKTLFYGNYAINNYDNLLPILHTNKKNLVLCTFISYLYSFIPNIFLLSLNTEHLTYKNIIPGYIIGSLSIITTTLIISIVFGFPLASIIRYPEYMVLKKISLFQVYKNIENILTTTWHFDCIVSGIIITNIVKKNTNKKFYYLYLILILLLCVKGFDTNYILTLYLYRYSYYILSTLSLLLITSIFINKKN